MFLAHLLVLATAILAAPFHLVPDYLNLEVYNPFNNSAFTIASEILTAGKETVLINSQFESKNAQILVDKIKATHNDLSLVYVSHSDPDYYFGLDVIQDAFPKAKIIATRATVEAINATYQLKQQTWDSQLGDQAPQRIVIPDPIDPRPDGYAFTIGHHHDVYILGPQANRTFVYIPTIDTVLGGVAITANEHVWMADTQTPESIQLWQQTLQEVKSINPSQVIPGHYSLNKNGSNPFTYDESVNFTSTYVSVFEQQAARASNSTQLINAMEQIYPQLEGVSGLETSAQVAKGELKWP